MSEPSSEQREAWDLAQIRQRPSRLNVEPIGSMIRRVMAKRGYGETQAADQLQAAWRSAAGEALARETRAGRVTRGTLTVFADSSVALQELQFQKAQIIKALNITLPNASIKKIRGQLQT